MDAELSQLLAVSVGKHSPASVVDVTTQAVMVQVGPGLHDVVFPTPQSLRDVAAFSIHVVHDKGSGIVHGSALISQRQGNDDNK